jgi:hypothetical protein
MRIVITGAARDVGTDQQRVGRVRSVGVAS